MERRVFIFFTLSFLIIAVYIFNSPKNQLHTPTPAAESTPAAVTSQTLVATPAATANITAAPAPAPTPASPTVSRAKASTVAFKNDGVCEVVFSAKGGVPIRWDIIDPRFAAPPMGMSRETAIKKGLKLSEPLIDPVLNENEAIPRPYETVLRESGAAYYNNFNSDLYTTATVREGDRSGYRFTSPPSATGLQMVKTYLFDHGKFTGAFKVELVNRGKYNLTFDRGGDAGLGVIMGPGLGKVPLPEEMTRNILTQAAVKQPDTFFYKAPTTPGEAESITGAPIEWGGVQSLYYLSVLIPQNPSSFSTARLVLDPNVRDLSDRKDILHLYPDVELYTKPFSLTPGQSMTFSYEFYTGPKEREILLAAGHDLARVNFYDSWNWVRGLCIAMMKMLFWLQKIFINWGVAIIVLTIVVRIITFPLVQKGMKSQAKMMADQARIKPLMDKVNEKYKSDPQRKQQEIFKLYKEHGVNPFGAFKGCLWMMIQMPILISLYYVINQTIDLRGGHFLWIQDLAQPDRLFRFASALPLLGHDFNLLPLIMTATQIFTSKFSTQPASDPQQQAMQRNMTYMMPVMMLFIFYTMPSGLVLYWTVSNIWQVGQQLWVNKHIKKPQGPMSPPTTSVAKKA